ncbi:RNA-dependent ATPase [Rhizophlyctis rosea]|nr:RNA-dependent ATPase [Rhizophlyctis rosea]
MSIESSKKDKSKKRKEKPVEDTDVAGASPVVEDVPKKKAKKLKTVEGGDHAEGVVQPSEKKEKKDKKDKKDKKKKEKKEQKEEAAVVAAEESDTKSKKTKKRKSDDKKEEGTGEENGAAESTAGDEESEGKKKKRKKEKKDKSTTDELPSAPFKSNTWSYTEHPTLKALPKSEIDTFLTKNTIEVTGSGPHHRPILQFSQASFPADLHKALSTFPAPTSIQSVTWPPILSGRDLVGIAATGSGKTLAFGVPALLHIRNRLALKNTIPRKPQVLVLSPTRELAMQIQEQFERFGSPTGAKSVCVYGGVDKRGQRDALREGMNIIVATPGRLIDLVEEDRSSCDLSDVSYLVLDEADRMLDQGFEEAIKKLLKYLTRKERQNVMFSATWPPAIQKLSAQYLSNPIRVTVGSTDLSANTSITQIVEVINAKEPRFLSKNKENRLLELLRDYHKSRKNRILIFALYKKEAARLEEFLRRSGYKVGAIHGDLGQAQRTQSLERFKDGTVPLLIATDVAARGIDIPNVEYVINVTFPLTVEDYCHRIGRTGRAGAKGISHTMFTVEDKQHSGALINVLKQAGQEVPEELFKFGTTVKKKVDPNYGAFVKDVDMNVKGTKMTFDSDDE